MCHSNPPTFLFKFQTLNFEFKNLNIQGKACKFKILTMILLFLPSSLDVNFASPMTTWLFSESILKLSLLLLCNLCCRVNFHKTFLLSQSSVMESKQQKNIWILEVRSGSKLKIRIVIRVRLHFNFAKGITL